MSTPERLYRALVRLREASDPRQAAYLPDWRVVQEFLRDLHPARDADSDEAQQETMLAILYGVASMDAETPLAAAKWVARIYRNKRVDVARARARNPVDRGLARTRDDEGASALEHLAAEDGPPIAPDVLERVLAAVEEQVDAHLRETEPKPEVRHLRRLQARAALHRLVLGAEFEDIVAVLDAGEPLSRDRVYKWVERGRAVVTAALERWVRSGGEGSTVAEIAVAVREIVEERRADAGRPRPARRRRGDG